jgi:DNA-binding transcriptional LysR family regulator
MDSVRIVDLREMETFLAVVDEGSFTRAADRRRTVQSAVSATIRRLERELDVALFDRTSRQVSLTAAGSALVPEARRILAAADAARDAVDAVRGGLRGTVVLGIMQTQRSPAVSLPRLLARFGADHPGVDVAIRHAGGSALIAEHIRAGRMDAGFLALGEDGIAGLRAHTLAREPMELLCAADHPLAALDRVPVQRAAEEDFVELPPGWGTRIVSDRAFARHGRHIRYEVNDTGSLMEFVRYGLAVALAPASFAADIDAVRSVPLEGDPQIFATSIAVSATRRTSAATEALIATALRQAAEA